MAAATCPDCGFHARSERGLTAHRNAKHPPQREGTVFGATVAAVEAAKHLTDADQGAVAVLLDLARTIDGMPERDAEAPLDNVTIPTYLKFSDALGLTPLSRQKLDHKEGRGGSRLAELRAIAGGKSA